MTVSFAQMTITGAVMIAVIVLLRALLLDRLPKRTFMWLWALAVLRLVLPFGLRLSLNIKLPEQIHEEIVKSYEYDNFLEGFIPIFTENTEEPEKTTVKSETVSNTAATTQSEERTERTAKRVNVPLVIYISGAALTAACFGALYIYGYKKFGKAQEVQNEACEYWLKGHKIRRRLQIRELSCITSPMTYGVIRPKILVPEDFDWHDSKTVKFVLEHEFQHVKRLDSARKLILCGVLCMHWFNPLVWLMYFLVNRDIELCCDEAVIGALGIGERAAYARSLIAIEADRTGYLTFAHFGQGNIKRRIISIMKIRKRTALSIISAVLIVTLLGACAAVTEIGTTEPEQSDDPTVTPAAPIQTVTYDEPEEEAIDYSGRKEIIIYLLADTPSEFPDALDEAERKFNEENTEYYVSFTSHFVEHDTAIEEINNGTGADILFFNDSRDLEAMGVLMNLYDFMENDDELTKDDLLLTQAMEYYDGGLYALGTEFNAITYLALTSKVKDICDDWTLENWEKYAEGYPSVTSGIGENILYEYLVYENMNENIEEILKLAKLENDVGEKAKALLYKEKIRKLMQDDELLLYKTEINSPEDIEKLEDFFGEDLTIMGLPEHLGYVRFNNMVGISASAKYPEGAWEFIKCFMEVTNRNTSTYKGVKKEYTGDEKYIEKFNNFIDSVTAVQVGDFYKINLIRNAVQDYFSGEETAKACAEQIISKAILSWWSAEIQAVYHPTIQKVILKRLGYVGWENNQKLISLDCGETWVELVGDGEIEVDGELKNLVDAINESEKCNLIYDEETGYMLNPLTNMELYRERNKQYDTESTEEESIPNGTSTPVGNYIIVNYRTDYKAIQIKWDEDGNMVTNPLDDGNWYVTRLDREAGDYVVYINGEWQELHPMLK